ncbi:unnamed protein product [Chrysoparadoxa australica]
MPGAGLSSRRHLGASKERIRPSPPQPPSRGVASPHFRYNETLLPLVLPATALVLVLGGEASLLTLCIGLMICYCLDLIGTQDGTILAFCTTMLGWVCVWFGADIDQQRGWAACLAVAAHSFLLLVWGLLQFDWLLREELWMCEVLESVLLTCFPFTCAAVIAWGVAVAVGAEWMALTVMGVLYMGLLSFGRPLRSSVSDLTILPPRGLLELSLVLLPPLVHFASTRTLFTLDVVVPTALPWILLYTAIQHNRTGALWWLVPDTLAAAETALRVVAMACCFAVLEVVKSRVLVDAFGSLGTSSRYWGGIYASGFMYGALLSVLLRSTGLGSKFTSRALAVLASRCLGMALSAPWHVMPVFDASAVALATFADSRKLWHCVTGVTGLGLAIMWIARRAVWELHPTLKMLTALGSAVAMVVLLTPGLVLIDASPAAVGALLALHAVGLAAAEAMLIEAACLYPESLDQIYPSAMVLLTGLVGLWVVWRLTSEWQLQRGWAWLVGGVNIGKICALGVVLVSSGSSNYRDVLLPVVLLLLACSAPLLLIQPSQQGGELSPAGALVMLVAVGAALALSARPVLAVLLQALYGEGSPDQFNTFQLLGAGGVCLSLGVLAMLSRFFVRARKLKRLTSSVLVTSMLLLVTAPAPSVEAAVLAALFFVTLAGLLPMQQLRWRVVLSIAFGGFLGSTLLRVLSAKESSASMPVATAGCGAMVAVTLLAMQEALNPRPNADASFVLPVLFAVHAFACVASLASGLLSSTQLVLPILVVSITANTSTAAALKVRSGKMAPRQGYAAAGAIAQTAAQAMQQAEMAARSQSSRGRRWVRKMGNACTAAAFSGGVLVAVASGLDQKQSGSRVEEGGSAVAVPLLSSLLLLLQHEERRGGSISASNAAAKRRLQAWAPVITAASVAWSVLVLYHAGVEGIVLRWGQGEVEQRQPTLQVLAAQDVSTWGHQGLWPPLWNLILGAATLPTHYLLVGHLRRGGSSPQQGMKVFACLAVNLLPLAAAQLASVRMMAILGLLGGGGQIWLAREMKARSSHLI